MSRLIVVSNRVPSSTEGECTGGLAVAVKAALEESDGVWVGWSGRISDDTGPRQYLRRCNGFDLATTDLSTEEFRGYYEQHANRVLWPLFHGRLDLVCFDRGSYSLYRGVNRRFARLLRAIVDDDDIVWVHDYHLLPLGAELRRLGIMAPIGFFLHIPFPPPGTLAALPCHYEMLNELSAYDVVGVQTTDCLRNFDNAMERRRAGEIRPGATEQPNYLLAADSYPVGIETDAFAKLAASPKASRWCRQFRSCMNNQAWAAGVDRLDYTKGLAERFLAFEALFDHSPTVQGRLSLIQIAAPSRETLAEYQEAQKELETLSGRINARLGRFDWMPIRFINRAFGHTTLAALYRVSRIGVVTPMRDGMNLVAKEYVAAQDPEDPGVLVLSSFAGAAHELTEALLVNPHDKMAVAEALRTALEMPIEERRARWAPMMRRLQQNDVHHWCRSFLATLSAVRRPTSLPAAVA
jgi:trehalose 6-phosphate synthase